MRLTFSTSADTTDSPAARDAFTTFEWGRIRRGDKDDVLDNDMIISSGVVDDCTSDREVVWLQVSYGRGRRMFHQQDGWQLCPVTETS